MTREPGTPGARRVRLTGLADGFSFDHTGEIELEAPKQLVVRFSGSEDRKLLLAPRYAGHAFPGPGPTAMSQSEADPPRDKSSIICSFRYVDARQDQRPGHEAHIAAGIAHVRFTDEAIEVTVEDHTADTPTSTNAPRAP